MGAPGRQARRPTRSDGCAKERQAGRLLPAPACVCSARRGRHSCDGYRWSGRGRCAGGYRVKYVYIHIYMHIYIYIYIYKHIYIERERYRCLHMHVFNLCVCVCRDGGNTFTPERYRLELNSAHTFTGRQAPSDPRTVSGVFFLRSVYVPNIYAPV